MYKQPGTSFAEAVRIFARQSVEDQGMPFSMQKEYKETACYLLCNRFFCKSHARKLLQKYNTLAYEQKEEKEKILKELCGKIGWD